MITIGTHKVNITDECYFGNHVLEVCNQQHGIILDFDLFSKNNFKSDA
jgi:hypothetical protein